MNCSQLHINLSLRKRSQKQLVQITMQHAISYSFLRIWRKFAKNLTTYILRRYINFSKMYFIKMSLLNNVMLIVVIFYERSNFLCTWYKIVYLFGFLNSSNFKSNAFFANENDTFSLLVKFEKLSFFFTKIISPWKWISRRISYWSGMYVFIIFHNVKF